MKKRMLFCALISICTFTQADEWSDYTHIKELYPQDGGLSFVTDEYSNSTWSSCDGGRRFHLPVSEGNYETKASILMAAFMANREITFAVLTTTQSCEKQIDRFRIR